MQAIGDETTKSLRSLVGFGRNSGIEILYAPLFRQNLPKVRGVRK